MEKIVKNILSIVVIEKDYLTLKTHGSFFRTKDLKKSCDIDINQFSTVEKLNSFLLELAEHLIKKKKEYPNLIIQNIELDTITDERIDEIIKDMNKFNFKLKHILESNKQIFPILNTNISKTLPKDVIEKIEILINNYNSNNSMLKLFELFKLHSYLKNIQKIRT
jgi:hypothetical protein